jgi:DNA-binding response OmpR family regulator
LVTRQLGGLRCVHALILEDDLWAATAIGEALIACGYSTFAVAEDGEAAGKLLHMQRPDLITADRRLLKGENGFCLARNLARQVHAPIIYVTAFSGDLAGLPAALLVRKPFAAWEVQQAAQHAVLRV